MTRNVTEYRPWGGEREKKRNKDEWDEKAARRIIARKKLSSEQQKVDRRKRDSTSTGYCPTLAAYDVVYMSNVTKKKGKQWETDRC